MTIPIVVVAEDRASALSYSFVKDYFIKPLTTEKFTALIHKLYPER